MDCRPVTHSSLIRLVCERAAPGLVMEFGVFEGRTLRQFRNFRKPPIVGFDTFTGLPEAWDTGGPNEHPAGHFACEKPKDLPYGVSLVEGPFEESLSKWLSNSQDEPQVIHIDSDLYSSAKTVLTHLDARLKPGAVILFDELVDFKGAWYPNWPDGEWKALVEWMQDFGREVKPIGRTEFQQVAFVITK